MQLQRQRAGRWRAGDASVTVNAVAGIGQYIVYRPGHGTASGLVDWRRLVNVRRRVAVSFLPSGAGMFRYYPRDARSLLRRRGWLAGWVSVTRRYCV